MKQIVVALSLISVSFALRSSISPQGKRTSPFPTATYFNDPLNVMDFGAKGDGVSDDLPAFQAALKAAANLTGNKVIVPTGNYLISGCLEIPPNTLLEGIWVSPITGSPRAGSVIETTQGQGDENGTPFITLRSNAALSGLVIFYPNQDDKAPVPYPWTVRANGDDCSLINVQILNPWNAVDFGTITGGRHYIKGLYSQPLHTGLYIDNTYDIGRVEDVHFWPFWTQGLMDYTTANAIAFVIGRTDWEYMENCFDICYKIGFHFITGQGGPGNVVLVNSGSDEPGLSVVIDDTESHAGLSFVNGQFMGGVIVNSTNTGPIKFTSCGFWGMGLQLDSHAIVNGGHTMFTGCHFIYWGNQNPAAPCIAAGNNAIVSVTGCDFMDANKPQLSLGPDVRAATFVGNTCAGAVNVQQQCDSCLAQDANIAY